jgi:hypothetical protein
MVCVRQSGGERIALAGHFEKRPQMTANLKKLRPGSQAHKRSRGGLSHSTSENSARQIRSYRVGVRRRSQNLQPHGGSAMTAVKGKKAPAPKPRSRSAIAERNPQWGEWLSRRAAFIGYIDNGHAADAIAETGNQTIAWEALAALDGEVRVEADGEKFLVAALADALFTTPSMIRDGWRRTAFDVAPIIAEWKAEVAESFTDTVKELVESWGTRELWFAYVGMWRELHRLHERVRRVR